LRFKYSIKQILISTRSYWDQPEFRGAVRRNFDQVTKCGTSALGAEVFASGDEKKLVFHTCKARPCPSCGHRATIQWQREQWHALPDIPYLGIVFTMPQELWSIFRQNRHLPHDLPRLGAAVLQQWGKLRGGVELAIMVIPHTFGAKLNFNPHLHMLVSAGGLKESDGRWVRGSVLEPTEDKNALMQMWRFAVVSCLRVAHQAGIVTSNLSRRQQHQSLQTQYDRWWNIHIDRFASKEHFLRYAGRYVRRPPIAQHRLLRISKRAVEFWAKDKKQKRNVIISLTPEEFVASLADHVPDHYRHAVRYFGLLAPASRSRAWAGVFVLLGKPVNPRPRRLSWAFLRRRDFGVDPLLDRRGLPMKWIGRLQPQAT
jgi:hypothetical protein